MGEQHDDDGTPDISAGDGEALTALFAALVAEPPSSDLSPEKIIEIGRADRQEQERRVAQDELSAARQRRASRLRWGRNGLIAAAAIALIAVAIPRLQSSPGQATSADVALSTSNASAAGSVAAGSTGGNDSSAPASGAASFGAAAPAPAAGSSAAGLSASSSAAASSASLPSAGAGCAALPASALAAARAALPTGSQVESGCGTTSRQDSASVSVSVRVAPSGACLAATAPTRCARLVAGTTDAYQVTGPAAADSGARIIVYGGGYEVVLAGAPTRTQAYSSSRDGGALVAAGRAVIKALG